MAQRKSPPAGKSTGNRGSSSPSRSTGPAASKGAPARPPAKKKPKSIVNQKQTPWGLIITTIAVVAFAAAVVIVVIATSGGKDKNSAGGSGTKTVNKDDPYRQPELAAAKAIQGVTYQVEGQHQHVDGVVKYDASPPVGGNHSQLWANCTGTVYTTQIANENAVHMLEHGAVWITYNPDQVKGAELTKLESYVKGQDRLALSPYAGLKQPISLQAWGYQLFVDNASDPRIAQFIATLKYNPKTTPEQASCNDPYFKADKSTPGHPQENA
jgi:Protein of unknown function (DUF3105)